MKRIPWVWVALLGLVACGCGSSSTQTDSPAGFDPTYLDHSVDPCADFYQYACGTWIAQHQVPAGFVEERFFTGDERDQIYFSDVIEAMNSSDPNLHQAQQFYASCMTAHATQSTASGKLNNDLSAVAFISTLGNLPAALSALHQAGVGAMFTAAPQIDAGNPTHYIVTIGGDGFSLPEPSSYEDASLKAEYEAHMTALQAAAASTSSAPSIAPEDVFAFEQALVELSQPDSMDVVSEYNPTASADLMAQSASFDWAAYFNQFQFGNVPAVNLPSQEYATALSDLLSTTPLSVIREYLDWRVLEADASYIDKPLIDEEFHFHESVLQGAPANEDHDQFDCLSSTRGAFSFVLARHFVESFVPSDLRPNASALVDTVRASMRQNLTQVSWLDDATRAAALDKADLLLPKVGYPDVWPNTAPNFDSSSLYLDLVGAVFAERLQDLRAKLGATVDRSEFWASPEITNAFYSPVRNDITIPVAVLQDPFFNSSRPAAFNFGALGATIGHELTHGFDDNGRHFDGIGMLTNWWTDATAAEFERRTQCLVDQFNGYEAVPGHFVDGKVTLNENIADLGGMKLAYAAFEADAKRKSDSSAFSPEQQFFLSFAQLWCESMSTEAAALQLAADVHSPAKYRVNGVVRNLPAFAQAFSCPVGGPLVPNDSDRCEIW
ncbi:MAG TPA: M13 family metallopeptidase [Polyangiaceae bacterium]|jgi:endothelin-converting enzyme/putative endopeptidase